MMLRDMGWWWSWQSWLMVEVDDLKGISQPKLFCVSMNQLQNRRSELLALFADWCHIGGHMCLGDSIC